MLAKLQRKTLPYAQIAAYLFTLFIGAAIILITLQFYADMKPLLVGESDVFKNNAVVLNKNISLLKTLNKDRIYFSDDEIKAIADNDFVKETARFHTAGFEISAYIAIPRSDQMVGTNLFFESVPDKYLDIRPDDWVWEEESGFIPIIVPESYLNLYNFGFAESQGLPVISEGMISRIGFNLVLEGNNKEDEYRGRIVGLSNKINSILVPEDFLLWANDRYGTGNPEKTTRLLVEFTDPGDERIAPFLTENNYSVNKQELEQGKLLFFFRSALLFVGFIALIIILLSSGFILLSINLITQKNQELILNLYNIGYSPIRIARFYQAAVSVITALSIGGAAIAAYFVRKGYTEQFKNLFEADIQPAYFWAAAAVLLLVLLVSYNVLLLNNIRKITRSRFS